MLPANIDSLLREQIDTDLRTKGKSERDVARTALENGLRSGFRPAALVAPAQLEEIGNRSKIIADAILKVLQDVKVTPYPGLVQDLVNLYEERFNAVVDEWMPRLRKSQQDAGGTGDGGVTPKIEGWRAEHRMEVKRRGAAIMEAADPWEKAKNYAEKLHAIPQTDSSEDGFTENENNDIQKTLEEIKNLLLEHVKNDERKKEYVTEQFRILHDAATKFGKKDYLMLAYTAVIGMATTIGVPPDVGTQIWQMLIGFVPHIPRLIA